MIGFDAHPDSFTAALLVGRTPAEAITQKVFNKIPIAQLRAWAQRQTTAHDLIVLEASGNSFEIARVLQSVGRKARVLESCHLGKLKEAHANNDKISAVRIGKAFLAGTTKEVWIPDPKTQEWRDWYHAHRKAVRRSTQVACRLRSYLSDNGLRLGARLDSVAPDVLSQGILSLKAWSTRQAQVLEGLVLEWRHAREQVQHWGSLIAQEVSTDPLLLSLVRLCGVRDTVAFALGAIVGDIHRFANPRKLVKYVGLNPAFDDSGEGQWRGGIGGHGRSDLRALLIESAQSILRSKHPLAKWGRKLLARKSSINLVAAALARKLIIAVWYLMMGRWTPAVEIDRLLSAKIGKIISRIGNAGLKKLDRTRRSMREQMESSLQSGRIYILTPPQQFVPRPKETKRSTSPVGRTNSIAQEYGLA